MDKLKLVMIAAAIIGGLLIGRLSTATPTVATDEISRTAYKEYLHAMLVQFQIANDHLKAIEENTKAVREKMGA
jgi:hypothetical protein